jgi:Chaperone of endosialidase
MQTRGALTLVDFVPFPGMASTDNNTQYPANQIMITGNGGTVTASGSMVAVPSTNQIGVGTTAPLGPFDVNVSASFRQGFTTQNVAVFSSLISNGTATFGNINVTGTEQVNYLIANVNVIINGTTASTNSISGAMINKGGEGIAGNLNVGGAVSTFTGAVGIGTASGVGIATTANSANLWVYGNVVLANTPSTSSGIIFPDGTKQTTAGGGGGSSQSYGPLGTIQVAGSSNSFAGDGSNFFWDNSNKRLGIGTSTPAYQFSLFGTDYVLFNSRPGAAVRQEITVGNTVSFGSILGYDSTQGNAIGYLRLGTSAATQPAIAWSYVSTNSRVGINATTQPQNAFEVNGSVAIGFNYAGVSPMTNTNGASIQGQVGIGTFTPGAQLDVLRSSTGQNTTYHLQFQNSATGASGQTNINYLFGGVQQAYQRIDYLGNMVWNSGSNTFYFNLESIGSGTGGTANFNNNTQFMQTQGAAVTFPGNVSISQASGPQIKFTGGTSNYISWNTSGVAAPTFTTSSAGTKLLIYPNVTASLVDYAIGIASNLMWLSVPSNTSTYSFAFYGGTTQVAYLTGVGNLYCNGEITAYASDSRLKLEVEPITDPIGKVMAINGVTFKWDVDKAEPMGFKPHDGRDVGVIAQEVQAVLPEAVRPAPFDSTAQGQSRSGENYLTVQYEKLTALLIEAVKAQQAQIELLEARITTLEQHQ